MAELVLERTYYYPGLFVMRLINAIIGIIEFVFVLRLILELLGANPASQFVALLYAVTNTLLGPFAGAFSNLELSGGFVIDVNTIVAMIGYAIIGWLIVRFLEFIFSSPNFR